METSGRTPRHNYVREQRVEVQDPNNNCMPPTVEIVALLPDKCTEHGAPFYGCVHNDNHFRCCEAILKPLSTQSKRRLN